MITQDWQSKELHPLVAAFRVMRDSEEYEAFLADIEKNGIRVPIVCDEAGRIIDGRHRQRGLSDLADLGKDMQAIIEKSVSPLYVGWDGQGSLVDAVLSLNLHRRHLTTTDKGLIGIEVKKLYQAEIKQGHRTDKSAPDLTSVEEAIGQLPIPKIGSSSEDELVPVDRSTRESAAMAGAKLGISADLIRRCERIQRQAPDLFEEMQQGSLEIGPAERAYKERVAVEQADEQRRNAATTPTVVAKAAPSNGLIVNHGEFWKLGNNVVYCGRSSDEAFRNFKFKQSDMNGERAELCISLVYDSETAEDLVAGQKWLLSSSVILAAVVQPVDLQGVLTNIKKDCLGTLCATIDGDYDKGEIGVNKWWATCLFGEKWTRQFVDEDQRMFYPKKEKCGDTSYASGGRPLAYYQWITQMLTDKGDTVIVTALNDGQALFAAEGLRNVYGAESDPNKLRDIIDRWCRTHDKQAERISA